MTSNRPGVGGMASSPHPRDEDISSEAQSLPEEEDIETGNVEDDVEESPDEKRNATDGYAPTDDDAETTTVDDLAERAGKDRAR
jgi:hypothetical protein